jgi:hypothetical protein
MKGMTLFAVLICTSLSIVRAKDVTVQQLLANPQKYNGKRVSVVGYYILENEESCLFATRETAKRADFKWSVWVDFRGSNIDTWPDQKVRITGTFHHMRNADSKRLRGYGQWSLFANALQDATTVVPVK